MQSGLETDASVFIGISWNFSLRTSLGFIWGKNSVIEWTLAVMGLIKLIWFFLSETLVFIATLKCLQQQWFTFLLVDMGHLWLCSTSSLLRTLAEQLSSRTLLVVGHKEKRWWIVSWFLKLLLISNTPFFLTSCWPKQVTWSVLSSTEQDVEPAYRKGHHEIGSDCYEQLRGLSRHCFPNVLTCKSFFSLAIL